MKKYAVGMLVLVCVAVAMMLAGCSGVSSTTLSNAKKAYTAVRTIDTQLDAMTSRDIYDGLVSKGSQALANFEMEKDSSNMPLFDEAMNAAISDYNDASSRWRNDLMEYGTANGDAIMQSDWADADTQLDTALVELKKVQ